ncbi:MAG: CoA transferase [Solirubrobacterales bacterium]|nr:CoA transferase [Solirubrobacterales bacterium]
MTSLGQDQDQDQVRTRIRGEGPLGGVRILELGSLIAGPFATRLLADFGAEVIKVEAPGRGDPMRGWGAARSEGRSLWWPIQTRGKKLITLDLRNTRGQALCRELASQCDVLVENFRPGTMERWGLGPEELAAVHPRLIYTRVSGYGQTGPYSSRGGFASAGEAMAGLRHLGGFPGEAPPRTGLSLGDSLSALFATIGILTALYERDTVSGEGQVVDASILESCFAMLESIAPEFDRLGAVRQPTGTRITNNAPSNIYRSRDEKWVVIAANSDSLWPRLAEAMGRAELAGDERFATHDARGVNEDELDTIIGAWAAEHDARTIDRLLDAAGVVCSPVNTIADVFADEHVQARGMLVPVHDEELGELRGPGIVPKLSRTPGRSEFRSTWTAGADTTAVFGELLGLDEAACEELSGEGVI